MSVIAQGPSMPRVIHSLQNVQDGDAICKLDELEREVTRVILTLLHQSQMGFITVLSVDKDKVPIRIGVVNGNVTVSEITEIEVLP